MTPEQKLEMADLLAKQYIKLTSMVVDDAFDIEGIVGHHPIVTRVRTRYQMQLNSDKLGAISLLLRAWPFEHLGFATPDSEECYTHRDSVIRAGQNTPIAETVEIEGSCFMVPIRNNSNK